MQVFDRPGPTSRAEKSAMAQLNGGKAYEPSLNSEPGCIKVVDTFRIGQSPRSSDRGTPDRLIQARLPGQLPLEVRNLLLGHEDGDEKTGSGADYGDLTPSGRLKRMVQAIIYPLTT
jgi:hypothetical protein